MRERQNVVSGRLNIGIVEPSQLVFEGLSGLLLKSGQHYQVFKIEDIEEIPASIDEYELNLIIVNPSQLLNRVKAFKHIKKISQIQWAALVYSFYDSETLSNFDEVIRVTDTPETIINAINKIADTDIAESDTAVLESLSERETEVLVQLVTGLSNKEIADKLNISIHTVISHRKNITQKTGIKSQSGLTIYALSNKIISLDNLG